LAVVQEVHLQRLQIQAQQPTQKSTSF